MTGDSDPSADDPLVGIEGVRAVLAAAVAVTLPEGFAPHPAGGTPPANNSHRAEDARDADPWAGMEPDFAPRGAEGEDGPPEQLCAAYPLNDVGNGRRFVCWYGGQLLFVGRLGWHVWDDRRWVLDAEISKGLPPRTRLLAQALGPLIEKEIPHLQPSESQGAMLTLLGQLRSDLRFLSGLPESERGADWDKECAQMRNRIKGVEGELDGWFKSIARHLTHAKNAGNSNAMNNFTAEASAILRREIAEMDADVFAVNCLSGTLRLVIDPGGDGATRSARIDLHPHRRGDLVTKIMPVDYDPRALCLKFDAFLARIQPAAEMRAFLRRWFGYSMFGSTSEQAMCYFFGVGANGKSVLCDLMARMIGEYAATARIQSLTGGERRGGGDATPDLMSLVGARMVRASEPDEGVQWNEGFMKEITGGEPMKVRALHSDFIDFNPIFKLTLSGNHKPEIRGTDDGIWRRLNIVPFTERIPKAERRDMGELIADLMTEAPGILNWLIAGAVDWAESGLSAPEAVTAATQTLREESDPVGQFLRETCLATGDPDDFMTRASFSEAFNFWLENQGLRRWSGNAITRRMTEKLEVWHHPETGKPFGRHKRGDEGYNGLKFKDLFRRRLQDAPRDHKGRILFKPGNEAGDGDA